MKMRGIQIWFEISTDSGATWDVVYSSLPWDIGNTIIGTTIDLSSYVGQSFQIAFRYFDATGYGEEWYVDNIRVWGGKNDNGEELPSGMYLYKLHAGSYIAMEKLVLLK